jgi:hypothetical protein
MDKGTIMIHRTSTTPKCPVTTIPALSLTTIPAGIMAEIATEIGRARIKYPEHDMENRIDGFIQEAGEASQAVIKFKHDPGSESKKAHARLELIQCAGQIIRLLTEGIQ